MMDGFWSIFTQFWVGFYKARQTAAALNQNKSKFRTPDGLINSEYVKLNLLITNYTSLHFTLNRLKDIFSFPGKLSSLLVNGHST